MPTIEITPTVAKLIKDERKSRHIRGDVISRSLGKTNTFISQIETGKLSEIDSNLFAAIFEQIIGKDNLDEYMNNLIQNTDILKVKYSEEEIEVERLDLSFHKRYCLIPIPVKIISFIKEQLELLGITGAQLVNEINKNKFVQNPEKYEDNKLYVEKIDGVNAFNAIIKFNLYENQIDDILSGTQKSIPYIFMLGIIFNILLLKGENENEAAQHASEILSDANFIPPKQLERKYRKSKLRNVTTQSDKYNLFEYEHYREYDDYINRIINIYQFFKASDILFTNNALKNHVLNLEYDPTLTLAILSSPLARIPKDMKDSFFEEYKLLLKKFCSNNDINEQKSE